MRQAKEGPHLTQLTSSVKVIMKVASSVGMDEDDVDNKKIDENKKATKVEEKKETAENEVIMSLLYSDLVIGLILVI